MIFTTDDGTRIPYPTAVLRGRLRLSGLDPIRTEELLYRLESSADRTQDIFIGDRIEKLVIEHLQSMESGICRRFELISRYYEKRNTDSGTPPLTIVLEGASATGKSVLSLELVQDLAATRIVGTDTIRQMLRTQMSPEAHPELFCHTYQAHIYAQRGPEYLSPAVRGYLAQSELILPHVIATVDRIVREGADCLVEGVHILPGSLNKSSSGVVEIVIDPPPDVHRAMFIGKSRGSGLKTVSNDVQQRIQEFEVAHEIQQYLVQYAQEREVHIVRLHTYNQALNEIRRHVITSIEKIVLGG